MTYATPAQDRDGLYALSWSYAQDGKLAVDLATGRIVDANPAAERLTGYTRAELIGMQVAMLHPEFERATVEQEFRKTAGTAAPHSGRHIQRKDGNTTPVSIWSSGAADLAGLRVVIVEIRDITLEKIREHQLSAQNWALSAFSIAALALGHANSAEGLQQSICDAITRQSVYVLAWIGVLEDGPERKVRVAASAGSAQGYLDSLHITCREDDPTGQGPVGTCIRTGQLQIVEDTNTSPVFGPWREVAQRFGIRSCACIPLTVDGDRQSVLSVYSTRSKAFESAPIEVFQHLAEQVAHGIKALRQKHLLDAERRNLEQTQRQLTEALSASVSAMVTAMEMRDPYTAGHENRTADIAYAIGKELGWSEGRLQGLRMAAMVHDIGKISIPSEILNKPSRLSAQEYALVKSHPESSYAILKDIPFTWPVADIVRQHHEKMDGSGYPLGLKGDEILPEAKVLTVADIVEAMAAARPYRKGLGLKVALAEIESQAGRQLDADAVRICSALFREKRLIIPGLHLD
jgi:PAS domain S-box-containing protein